MSAGYSGTPLPRKLGIGPGDRVAILADPGHAEALLPDLPDGMVLHHDPARPDEPLRGGDDAFDVVLAFVPEHAALDERFEHGCRLLAWDGGLWLAWPKKSSALHRDLAEGDVRARGLASGLVDNKICAVDEDWSGLRFVYRRDDRPS